MRKTGDYRTDISEKMFSNINQRIYRALEECDQGEIAIDQIILKTVLERETSLARKFRLIHFTKNLQPRNNEAAIRERGNKEHFSYRARAAASIFSFPAIELAAKSPNPHCIARLKLFTCTEASWLYD